MADLPIFYTTTNAIRGALGVDENEVQDRFLIDQNLAVALEVLTMRTFPTHATIQAEGTATSPTAAQTQRWQLLQLYVQWAGACHVAGTMRNAFPIMISDGKSQMRRGEVDFDALKAEMCAQEKRYQEMLEELLGTTTTGTVVAMFGSAKPSYDPVVGDRTRQ